MKPVEIRRVHRFRTDGYDSFSEMWDSYQRWLARLPGRLFSEGPLWTNGTVRVAITVEDAKRPGDETR